MKAQAFLPHLLERRAEELLKLDEAPHTSLTELIHEFDRAIQKLEGSLRVYDLEFPLFMKVDAWRSLTLDSDSEVWILERVGWGKWGGRNQLLYVMESVEIPQIEDAEVLSVNSNSPPFLMTAKPLDWEAEVEPEEVQAIPLLQAPELLKEKCYPCLPEFLFFLGETLHQMDQFSTEFQDFVEEKIDEFIRSRTRSGDGRRRSAVQKYFRTERRAELFMEFLQNKHSDGA